MRASRNLCCKTDLSQGVSTLDLFMAQTFPFSTLVSVENIRSANKPLLRLSHLFSHNLHRGLDEVSALPYLHCWRLCVCVCVRGSRSVKAASWPRPRLIYSSRRRAVVGVLPLMSSQQLLSSSRPLRLLLRLRREPVSVSRWSLFSWPLGGRCLLQIPAVIP